MIPIASAIKLSINSYFSQPWSL